MVADPGDANTIWRREHNGMFRTKDGGDTWQRIEKGLPSEFGFPLVMDRRTNTLFCVPLESDEQRMPKDGKLRLYRSTNGGASWAGRAIADNVWCAVLRGAMSTDQLDPCGLYVGTGSGTLHASRDAGDTWKTLPVTLPRILHVSAYAR